MKISDLNPVEYNPRAISAENLDRLKASIKAHSPAVENARDGAYRLAATITINRQGSRVVGGHKRLQALQALGQTEIDNRDLTWVDLDPGSDAEKALCIALNAGDAQGLFRWSEVAAIEEYLRECGAEWVEASGFSEATLASIASEGYQAPDVPDDDEGGGSSGHDVTGSSVREIKVPASGRAVVERAITKVKAKQREIGSNAQAVEWFCRVWMEPLDS
jgi:hypothetical protein